MGSRARDHIALAIAVAAHGLGLLALSFLPPVQRATQLPLGVSDEEEVLVELLTTRRERPSARTHLAAVAQEPSIRPPSPGSGRAALNSWVPLVSEEGTGYSVDEPAPGEASSPADDGEQGAGQPGANGKRPLSLEQIGVGARLHYPIVAPSRRLTKRRIAEAKLRRSMSQTVATRDAQLGLGPQGPIIGALEQAARDHATPLNASALFVARVDARGRLVDLSVVEASRDYSAWAKVASLATQRVKGNQLRLPDGARGVRVTIRLTSREQLPSGADPGLGVSIARIPVRKGKGDRSPQIEIFKPELKLEMVDVPNPSGGEPLRLPQVVAGITALNLGIDPADIGANAQRVIGAEVVSIESL